MTHPETFKQALEQSLRSSNAAAELVRERQRLIFDRLLARIVAVFGDAVTLKGGLALWMRLARARATRNIDLHLRGAPADLLPKLQRAGRTHLGDFLTFEIWPDDDHPNETPYDGIRFRAECKLAGKLYGQPFGVGITFDEPMLGEPEVVVAQDVLAFAGIAPPTLKLYPIETHIAEKLHAYTMPRARPSARVKDLPDILLLASVRKLEGNRLYTAFEQTFAFRDTHPLPGSIPRAPEAWSGPYEAMAREDQLPWETLFDVHVSALSFLDPVLARGRDLIWLPNKSRWE
ncbi:MAG: nucleotidyl transferase AbiEii/AbiGii toxin family protein [Polyangiaceae bacterium]